MKKIDLIRFIAQEVEVSQEIANKAINAMIEGISESLQKGDPVILIGFGSFKVTERKARKGRNPQTGKEIDIPASKAVKFSVGKALKDKVNNKKTEENKESKVKAKAKK